VGTDDGAAGSSLLLLGPTSGPGSVFGVVAGRSLASGGLELGFVIDITDAFVLLGAAIALLVKIVVFDEDTNTAAAKSVLVLCLEAGKALCELVPGLALLAASAGAGENDHAAHGGASRSNDSRRRLCWEMLSGGGAGQEERQGRVQRVYVVQRRPWGVILYVMRRYWGKSS
jgi:hypothetical protein